MAQTQLTMDAPSSRRQEVVFGIVGPPSSFPLASTTLMDRLFNKKPKKSLDPSKRHVSLGIPTNIAVGPLGFRAELDVDPKGEQGCSPHNMGADRTDSTAALDENGTRVSRIVFHDKKSEDQELPTPETSNHGAVVGGDQHAGFPISEYFQSVSP